MAMPLDPSSSQDSDQIISRLCLCALVLDATLEIFHGIYIRGNAILFILLINTIGGLTESDHAARLRLTMRIDEDWFVQSHTPFKTFVEQYKDEWIFVLGRHGSISSESRLA